MSYWRPLNSQETPNHHGIVSAAVAALGLANYPTKVTLAECRRIECADGAGVFENTGRVETVQLRIIGDIV